MPPIPITYASPSLRWGLLLEDFPSARCDFVQKTGAELGIPENFGGNQNFCVAIITFPPDSGKPPVSAWKPCGSQGSADEWNILQTKTLGRALKRAGYPDNTNDLRALVVWRQREAEIGAIKSGTAQISLPAAKIDKAIEAAGSKKRDKVSHDDGDAPDTESDDPNITDAEIVDDEPPPRQPTIAKMRQALSELGSQSKEVTAWAKKQGFKVTNPATEGEAQAILAYATKLNGVHPETGEVMENDEHADQIVELLEGLSDVESANFIEFCAKQSIDANMARSNPAALTDDQRQELLGWLEV